MTATQILEKLASSMIHAYYEGQVPENVAKLAAGLLDCATHKEAHETTSAVDGNNACLHLLDLPSVLLEQVCSYLDHSALHAVESASVVLHQVVMYAGLWKRLLLQDTAITTNVDDCRHSWKQMMCLTRRSCREDKQLLRGIRAYSSADRPGESPQNTLATSRCWREIRKFNGRTPLDTPHQFYDIPSFAMTLGERIQMKCGCSQGHSCYWSSSASLDRNAADYIDYRLDGPCVISCVQIVPYRVFWHPGSPTYAPLHVSFEFFECNQDEGHDQQGSNNQLEELPSPAFYHSPLYPVENDMFLQEFALPHKVWASKSTVLRIHLVGRHQAQTFELPPWLQRGPEDRMPKYYCCLSYVNALGLSSTSLSIAPSDPIASQQTSATNGTIQELNLPTALTEYMIACYEGLMERRRRQE